MTAVSTGMDVISSFALTMGAGMAFVLGGLMVYSTLMVSIARPIVLVCVFTASSFIFVYTAFMNLLRRTQTEFSSYLLQQERASEGMIQGLGQLFGIMSLVVGIIMLYAMDAIIYRLSMFLSSCDEPPLERPAPPCTLTQSQTASYSNTTVSSDCPPHVNPPFLDLSDCESLVIPSTEYDTCTTVWRALAVLLHHALGTYDSKTNNILICFVLEGFAVFVSSRQDIHTGVAITIAVALHSIPDGIALVTSIYFATGHRFRGILWCFLSPLGTLAGACIAWLLMGTQKNVLAHTVVRGITSGIVLGVGMKEVLPTTITYSAGKSYDMIVGIVTGVFLLGVVKLIPT